MSKNKKNKAAIDTDSRQSNSKQSNQALTTDDLIGNTASSNNASDSNKNISLQKKENSQNNLNEPGFNPDFPVNIIPSDSKLINTDYQDLNKSSHDSESNSDSESGSNAESDNVPLETIVKDFNQIRLFMKISGIAGPISLIVGGVLLGAVALIFGLLAYKKVKPYATRNDEFGVKAQRVKKFTVYAIAICIICIVINVIFIALYMPDYLAYMTSGDAGVSTSGTSTNTSSSTSSTWG